MKSVLLIHASWGAVALISFVLGSQFSGQRLRRMAALLPRRGVIKRFAFLPVVVILVARDGQLEAGGILEVGVLQESR